MLNQYKKETSQIHAPADLILKTKQAVREEEMRVQREKVQHTAKIQETSSNTNTAQNAGSSSIERMDAYVRGEGSQTKNGHGKVYKWALPVAAAVLFAVLMKTSTFMIGNKFTNSQSDSSASMSASEAEAGGAEYDFADEAAAEEFDDMDAGMDKAFADAGFATESAAAADEDGAAYDMYEESAAEESASVTAEEPKDDVNEDVENESEMSEGDESGLMIEEVQDIPLFCDDPNTECINVRGLQFYVAREWGNQWKAYVSVDDSGYLITGSDAGISDWKSFAGEAYELLAETVEGVGE